MALPVYTTNLVDITLAESLTNWSALGGGAAGIAIGPDFSMQGINCVDKPVTAAEKGQIFNYGSAITTGENTYFLTWVFLATPGLTASLQNRGLTIIAGTSTTAYIAFHVEGADTYGAAGRVGKCYPIKYNNTTSSIPPYRTLTSTPTGQPQYFGATCNITGTVKGSNLGVDAIRYGDGLYIISGDSTTPATITGAAYINDSINNRWGLLSKIGGGYELQGRLVIGQNTGLSAVQTYFSDSNLFVSLVNTPHTDSNFTKIIVDHSGTYFGLSNSSFLSLGTGNKGQLIFKNNLINSYLYNTSFTDFGTTNLGSGVTGQNCTWRRGGMITQSGAKIDQCLCEESYSQVALVSDNPQKISNTTFVSRGTGHAIEITKSGSYSFDGNIFTNYASVTGDLGTEAIYNTSSGSVTLNISNSTAPSYRNSIGSTTTMLAAVSVTLEGIKDNSEVRVYLNGTTTEIAGIETVTDGSPNDRTFTFSSEASTVVDIVVHHVDYEYFRIEGYTIPASTAFLPISQQADRVYENPA